MELPRKTRQLESERRDDVNLQKPTYCGCAAPLAAKPEGTPGWVRCDFEASGAQRNGRKNGCYGFTLGARGFWHAACVGGVPDPKYVWWCPDCEVRKRSQRSQSHNDRHVKNVQQVVNLDPPLRDFDESAASEAEEREDDVYHLLPLPEGTKAGKWYHALVNEKLAPGGMFREEKKKRATEGKGLGIRSGSHKVPNVLMSPSESDSRKRSSPSLSDSSSQAKRGKKHKKVDQTDQEISAVAEREFLKYHDPKADAPSQTHKVFQHSPPQTPDRPVSNFTHPSMPSSPLNGGKKVNRQGRIEIQQRFEERFDTFVEKLRMERQQGELLRKQLESQARSHAEEIDRLKLEMEGQACRHADEIKQMRLDLEKMENLHKEEIAKSEGLEQNLKNLRAEMEKQVRVAAEERQRLSEEVESERAEIVASLDHCWGILDQMEIESFQN